MKRCPECEQEIDPSRSHCPGCGATTDPVETTTEKKDVWDLEDLSKTEKILLANQFLAGALVFVGGVGAVLTGTGDGSSIFRTVSLVGVGWFVVAYLAGWFVGD